MKKVLAILIMVSYAHLSSAQNTNESVTTYLDTTSPIANSSAVEDRLNKQEQQIELLKKENESLKKQIRHIRSSINTTNRRTTISRAGSKQLVVE